MLIAAVGLVVLGGVPSLLLRIARRGQDYLDHAEASDHSTLAQVRVRRQSD